MFTARCPKCPKTFTKPTRSRAEQALTMHDGRKHSHRIPNRSHLAPVQARRKYTRRAKLVTTPAPIAAANYCYHCGTDQRVVAVAVSLVNAKT